MTTTPAQCAQVVPPVGPYSGGFTARISKVSPAGVRTTLVGSLPSSQTSAALGNLVSGVADVGFVGNTLYFVTAGSGCSHGLANTSNGIFRVNANATVTQIANLSAFQAAHPVAQPEEDDFEPDGTWYSMVAVRGSLYAVEPNHGELVRVTTDGQISRVIDFSAHLGHIVPTSIAYHGNFFVGNLGTFPVVPGAERVWKVTPSGQLQTWASGLTTVLGLAFDGRGRLYALESTTAPGNPTPGTGMVVRIDPDGAQTTIASGLAVPGGMTMGPDGALYVTNISYGAPPIGLGQVLRIELPS
jgi:SMP-30/Gluconolactonase/LRE-like region